MKMIAATVMLCSMLFGMPYIPGYPPTGEYEKDNTYVRVADYADTTAYNVKELFYHYSSEEIDWILVKLDDALVDYPLCSQVLFGDRIISNGYEGHSFTYGYAIFDMSERKLYSIEKVYGQEKYSDIDIALDKSKVGIQLGDLNGDGNLNIIDATVMQKYLTGEITKFRGIDGYILPTDFFVFDYMSYKNINLDSADMNRDGKCDVNDVTAMQKNIAKLDYLN